MLVIFLSFSLYDVGRTLISVHYGGDEDGLECISSSGIIEVYTRCAAGTAYVRTHVSRRNAYMHTREMSCICGVRYVMEKNAVATPDRKGRDPHMSTALDQRGRAWFT